MKDEYDGKDVTEFVGLRAKMYSIMTADGTKNRAKGVQRSVVKKQITFDDYKRTLIGCIPTKHLMRYFRNENTTYSQ
jgi:hypothetical protein